MIKHNRAVFLAISMAIILAGCGLILNTLPMAPGANPAPDLGVGSDQATRQPQGTSLIVYAAASLTDAFTEIGDGFEATHQGVRINFNFAGSQVLRTQIEQGAAADIFASADHINMDLLTSEALIAENSSVVFAVNSLVVILPRENPAGLKILKDLARPGLKIILADPSVPAGNYARQVLINLSKEPNFGADFASQVLANLVSNETDVRQVVTKVELGEADAGIAYVSDTIAVPGLITMAIPDEVNVIAHYPMAILANSTHPDLSGAFIDYVNSQAGQAILKQWGFSSGQ